MDTAAPETVTPYVVEDSPYYALGVLTSAAEWYWRDDPERLAEVGRARGVIYAALGGER